MTQTGRSLTENAPAVRERSYVNNLMADYVQRQGASIDVLEAGCGRSWGMPKGNCRITGVDLDEEALRIRREIYKDLDEIIIGDLRDVDFPDDSFDITFSRFVLEHVDGADHVLEKFVKWTKKDGLLILVFPDRDSVYGFITRITPLWFHVLYKRMSGEKNAGKPGFGPYATFHDNVLSLKAFRKFAAEKSLTILEECGVNELPWIQKLFTNVVSLLSLGRYTSRHVNLLFIARV